MDSIILRHEIQKILLLGDWEAKYARIINEISEMHSVSLEEAVDIFYNSPLLPLLEEGIADLHCRSDKYLAEEIWREKEETR